MARAVRIDVSGGIYHVIARGNERKNIFRDDDDRRIYLGRLAECQTQLRFRLLAYCLMSNHVHLAIQRGPRPLSRIMLSLQSFYAQRYNFRHRRVGHLFGERYKAFLIDHQTYLFALVRYIHWNPVRAGIVGRASEYRWSSDRFYRSGRAPSWLHTDCLLDALAVRREEAVRLYKRLMTDAARQTYEELEAYGRLIKGTRRFAERALRIAGRPGLRTSPSPETLCRAVAEVEGFTLERLREPGGGRDASRTRLIAAYLAERDAGICLAATARVFGREASTFSRGVRRLEHAIAQDKRLEARIGEIRRLVGESTHIHA